MNVLTRYLIGGGVVAVLGATFLLDDEPAAPAGSPTGLVRSEDLKGKVVVLDFWATWCAPCIEEIPNYNALHEEQDGDRFAILGITVESGLLEDVKPFLTEFGIEYPVVMGNAAVVAAFGGINAYPMTFVISPDWKVFKRYIGQFPPDKKEQIERDVMELTRAFGQLPDDASPSLTAGLMDAPDFALITVAAD